MFYSQKKTARDTVKGKLLSFLKKSKYYHAEKVLGDFPYTDLFEARAIILGRLGLSIFYHFCPVKSRIVSHFRKTRKSSSHIRSNPR